MNKELPKVKWLKIDSKILGKLIGYIMDPEFHDICPETGEKIYTCWCYPSLLIEVKESEIVGPAS